MRVDYDKEQLAYALANALKERDEAMKHLKEIEEYGTEEINSAIELRQKLATALLERDEAIEFSNSRIQLTDNLYRQITGLLDDLEEYKKENAKLRDIAERAIQLLQAEQVASIVSELYQQGYRPESLDQLRAELDQIKEGAK